MKTTFDELTEKLGKMSKELNNSFKDKVTTIKAMCATYFAKIDNMVNEAMEKVERITLSHDNFVANFVNPAKEVDAKVFAMQNQISNVERSLDGQISVFTDSMRKLLYALETTHMTSFNTNKVALRLLFTST